MSWPGRQGRPCSSDFRQALTEEFLLGQERLTRVVFSGPDGEAVSDGTALLETSELIFRGDFRLRISFRDIEDLSADGGVLALAWPGGRARFDLGKDAAKWAEKIRNPRSLLDKLGVKPGMRVAVIGVGDAAFAEQLRERIGDTAAGPAEARDADLIFYGADEVEHLGRLTGLRALIRPAGAIWVVSAKGKSAQIKDVDVISAARTAGLVDTKVVAFSETLTALKLVIPLAMRGPAQGSRAR